ncbi:hypothetical protein SmJEL517_g01550 [Synchytrium microbalum]|uniref:E3 ubiquitin protein ligase n=1 Tax=Synchytrium microbalum TaxID=1806994 RepID=A0A507C5S3_9FUNG|nr:uncharacterized protein SmJEL517_g01550 [Synchytrium microbalum]TPX36367.1 hypothetical protein SmJEL517_g01550 [Synchytrium microbalum]
MESNRRESSSSESQIRKRPSEDHSPASTIPKKTKLTNSTHELLSEASTDSINIDKAIDNDDAVVVFQKHAIWRQMQEYKRSLERAQKYITDLESRQDAYRLNIVSLFTYWEQIHDDIKEQVSMIDGQAPVNGISKNDLAQKLLANPACGKEEIEAALNAKVTSIRAMLDILARKSTPKSNGTSSSEQQHASLQQKYHHICNQVASLQSEVETAKQREAELLTQLEEATALLRAAERKADRLRMAEGPAGRKSTPTILTGNHQQPPTPHSNQLASASTLLSGVQGSPTAPVLQAVKVESTGSSEGVPNLASTAMAPPPPPISVDDKDDVARSEGLLIAQALSQARLKALEELKRERLSLQERVDTLVLQQKQFPTNMDLVASHPDFQKILNDNRRLADEARGFRDLNEKLGKQVEELQLDRRTFQQQVEDETMRKLERLDAELKKVEADLLRVRTQRDTLDDSLNLRLAKDHADTESSHEIRKIANAQKECIAAQTEEIRRLKICMAAQTGDQALIQYFATEDIDGTGNPIRDMRNQLQAFQQAASPEDLELQKILVENADAKRELMEYKSTFGALPQPGEDPVTLLSNQLRLSQAKIQEYERKIHSITDDTTHLASEVNKLMKGFGELQDQNTSKVLILTTKEDHILKLVAERTTMKQQLDKSRKETANTQNLITAIRRQTEKQTEVIRKLEDRENQQSRQVASAERCVAIATAASEAHRREMTVMLKKRTEEADTEMDLRRKAQEQADVFKKKLEVREAALAAATGSNGASMPSSSTISAPSDVGLQQRLDEYRGLIICRTCDSRFKSVVLSKCMHVFCKECIDDVLNARQRKCPTCGTAFGKDDVKTIYL